MNHAMLQRWTMLKFVTLFQISFRYVFLQFFNINFNRFVVIENDCSVLIKRLYRKSDLLSVILLGIDLQFPYYIYFNI